MSVESETAIKEIERKLNELRNVSRVTGNNLALLLDMEIKGAYAEPMLEVIQWLKNLDVATKQQIATLEATLPAKSKVEVVEAEVV
jgi:hypothetical protein